MSGEHVYECFLRCPNRGIKHPPPTITKNRPASPVVSLRCLPISAPRTSSHLRLSTRWPSGLPAVRRWARKRTCRFRAAKGTAAGCGDGLFGRNLFREGVFSLEMNKNNDEWTNTVWGLVTSEFIWLSVNIRKPRLLFTLPWEAKTRKAGSCTKICMVIATSIAYFVSGGWHPVESLGLAFGLNWSSCWACRPRLKSKAGCCFWSFCCPCCQRPAFFWRKAPGCPPPSFASRCW